MRTRKRAIPLLLVFLFHNWRYWKLNPIEANIVTEDFIWFRGQVKSFILTNISTSSNDTQIINLLTDANIVTENIMILLHETVSIFTIISLCTNSQCIYLK